MLLTCVPELKLLKCGVSKHLHRVEALISHVRLGMSTLVEELVVEIILRKILWLLTGQYLQRIYK